jgi:ferredoxin-NADP reductase
MFHAAKIVRKYLASPTVMVLELEAVSSLTTFSAGQWVDFVVKPHSWVGGFSIVSSPKDLPRMTLAVKRSSHAPSFWVHEESSVGVSVEVQVGGTCVLENESNDLPAVFCAGGIGISPVLCQYREYMARRETSDSKAPALFVYSVSTQEELVFADELSELHNKFSTSLDKMVFALTKSSEWKDTTNKHPNVELKTGRIMKQFLDEAPENSIFYVCGPPSMIDDSITHLENKGIPSSNIRYEKWW